jgi:hypothetical protein
VSSGNALVGYMKKPALLALGVMVVATLAVFSGAFDSQKAGAQERPASGEVRIAKFCPEPIAGTFIIDFNVSIDVSQADQPDLDNFLSNAGMTLDDLRDLVDQLDRLDIQLACGDNELIDHLEIDATAFGLGTFDIFEILLGPGQGGNGFLDLNIRLFAQVTEQPADFVRVFYDFDCFETGLLALSNLVENGLLCEVINIEVPTLTVIKECGPGVPEDQVFVVDVEFEDLEYTLAGAVNDIDMLCGDEVVICLITGLIPVPGIIVEIEIPGCDFVYEIRCELCQVQLFLPLESIIISEEDPGDDFQDPTFSLGCVQEGDVGVIELDVPRPEQNGDGPLRLTCTITNNVVPATLTAFKDCGEDDDGTLFTFLLLNDQGNTVDSDTVVCGGSVVFSDLLPGGYRVVEQIPSGSGLEQTLSDCGTAEALLEIAAAAEETCTITNAAAVEEPEEPEEFVLTISKVCVPTDLAGGPFTISAGGQVMVLPCGGQDDVTLEAGSVTLSETPVAGVVTFIMCSDTFASTAGTTRLINLNRDIDCVVMNFSQAEAPTTPPTVQQVLLLINNQLGNENDNENENENENENDNENNNTNISENNNTNTNTNTQNQTNNQTQKNDNNQVTNVTSSPNQSQNVTIDLDQSKPAPPPPKHSGSSGGTGTQSTGGTSGGTSGGATGPISLRLR